MSIERRCSNCEFWSEKTESLDIHIDDTEGMCRLNPPVLSHVTHKILTDAGEFSEFENAVDEVYGAAVWSQPVTYGMDWCGQFRQKKEPAG
jgi:hypothetical protein